MGYISYPRTGGSAKDIKRAEYVISLIDRLLQNFNPNDLTLLLTLVSRIGWHNLPPALRDRLLQLLYYDLFEKVKAYSKKNVGAVMSLVQPTTKMLIDILLQQQDLYGTSSLANFSLSERINKIAQVPISCNLVTQVNGYGQEMLVFDNGIHAILTTCASSDRYLKDQQKYLRLAIRAYAADTVQKLKQAHKRGMLVTINLLFDYVIKQNIEYHPSDYNQAVYPISYDIQRIQRGMLLHTGVRKVVIDIIEYNLGLTNQQKVTKTLGYKPFYRALQLYFLNMVNQECSCIVVPNKKCSFNFWVEDSQTQGTECRYLTLHMVKIARQFKAQGYLATLLEWLDKFEMALVCFFKTVRIKRRPNCLPCHYSLLEAELMAAAVRYELQQYLNYLNIPMSLTLNNQLTSQCKSTELPNLENSENHYVEF